MSFRNTIRKKRLSFEPDKILQSLQAKSKREKLIAQLKEKEVAKKAAENNIVETTVEEPEDKTIEVKKVPAEEEHVLKYSQDELVNSMVKGKESFNYVIQNFNVWNEIVRECDQALSDIRHFCELEEEISPDKLQELVEYMRYYGKRRRVYKNLMYVFQDFMAAQNRVESIYAAINEVKRKNKLANEDSMYRPRVLKDLFKDSTYVEHEKEA